MDAFEALYNRRSIRKYQSTPVKREVLEELLRAAMAAPSACNKQPWEFLVLDDPAVLEEVRTILPYGKFNAPAAILVCGNLSRIVKVYPNAQDFWLEDTSAAMQSLLTAATARGLGSVWIGVYPVKPIMDGFRALFRLPEQVVPMGLAFVGYADETVPPRTQYNEQFVHWNGW